MEAVVSRDYRSPLRPSVTHCGYYLLLYDALFTLNLDLNGNLHDSLVFPPIEKSHVGAIFAPVLPLYYSVLFLYQCFIAIGAIGVYTFCLITYYGVLPELFTHSLRVLSTLLLLYIGAWVFLKVLITTIAATFYRFTPLLPLRLLWW